MRYRFVLAAAMFIAVLPASALANGPSGSSEKGNQVKCAQGAPTPVGTLYAGANGIEICSGDNKPPDGRIIVTPSYVDVDGDKSNPGGSSGFLRVDKSGPSCGDAKHTDGTKKGGSCAPSGPPSAP